MSLLDLVFDGCSLTKLLVDVVTESLAVEIVFEGDCLPKSVEHIEKHNIMLNNIRSEFFMEFWLRIDDLIKSII